jgi:flavin-dependent thymidylate synthase
MSDNCMGPEEKTWLEKRREERMTPVFPLPTRRADEFDNRALLADVAFNRHSMNDGHHVSPSDNASVAVGTDDIRVALAQGIDVEAFKKTLTMATRATIGMDLTQTLPGDWEHCQSFFNWVEKRRAKGKDFQAYSLDPDTIGCEHNKHEYTEVLNGASRYQGKVPYPDWEEMLKGGLQTALETQTIVLAVSGVSRTCTHQLVRSRRAAFHQQSQRAGYMGDAPECRMPESIWRNERARKAFLLATMEAWKAYRTACEEDISYQDARFILPEGTTNFILLEYPVREFLNVYAYRACSMFQWEIVEVMRKARDVLIAEYPWLDPYIKISCEKTGPVLIKGDIEVGRPPETVEHHCTFQGWEDVEGQCDFPWAKQEARTFKPEFHRISRQTGKQEA